MKRKTKFVEIIDLRKPALPPKIIKLVVPLAQENVLDFITEALRIDHDNVTMFYKNENADRFELVDPYGFGLSDLDTEFDVLTLEKVLVRSKQYCVSYGEEGFAAMLEEGRHLYYLSLLFELYLNGVTGPKAKPFEALPKDVQQGWAGKVHFAFHSYHKIYTEPEKYGTEEMKRVVALYQFMRKMKEDYL